MPYKNYPLTIRIIVLTTICMPALTWANIKTTGQPTISPSMIWVADFSVDVNNIQMHPGPLEDLQNRPLLKRFHILQRQIPLIERYKDPKELTSSVVNTLADSITQALIKASLPAARLASDSSGPHQGWLLTGRFDRIEQGEIAEEAIIGFGHGDPKIEVSGIVADTGTPDTPFLLIGESSKKKRMPGGAVGEIITHTPYMIGAKFVLDSHATERDVKEIGRAIAKEIINYLVQKNLINNKQAN